MYIGDMESSDGEGAFRWWIWWGDGMGMPGNRAAAVAVGVEVVPEGGGMRKLQSVVLALCGNLHRTDGRTTSPERGIGETSGGVGRRENSGERRGFE